MDGRSFRDVTSDRSLRLHGECEEVITASTLGSIPVLAKLQNAGSLGISFTWLRAFPALDNAEILVEREAAWNRRGIESV